MVMYRALGYSAITENDGVVYSREALIELLMDQYETGRVRNCHLAGISARTESIR